MVYNIVICGVLLGIFIAVLDAEGRTRLRTATREPFDQASSTPTDLPPTQRASRHSILKDICRDLTNLFYFKSGQFIGLLQPLNNPNVLKNLVMIEDKESCTINKKTIHLCTKDPQTGKNYDKNTLMFVVLHELTHVLCEDVGHTEKFFAINDALLNYTTQKGLYDPSKPFVKNYCKI